MSERGSGSGGIGLERGPLLVLGALTVFSLLLRIWWAAALLGAVVLVALVLDHAVRRGWMPGPGRSGGRLVRGRRQAVPELVHAGPLPELDETRKARVRHVVETLAAYGVFAPETPDPALLFAGVAREDAAGDVGDVLAGLEEVPYYHPGADPGRWMANLERLDPDSPEHDLRAQLAEAARTLRPPAAHRAPRDAALRMAWLWDDPGPWTCLLPDGAVPSLNAALRDDARGPYAWDWVDDASF